MGNWRTVTITGTIDPADVPAARRYVEIGDDWTNFHCLAFVGMSLCGLGRWVPPLGGTIHAVGNLAERDYTPEDVAEALTGMVAVAPSLAVKVHCGDDWESTTCIATVMAVDGRVSVGEPEVATVGEGMSGQGARRLATMLIRGPEAVDG